MDAPSVRESGHDHSGSRVNSGIVRDCSFPTDGLHDCELSEFLISYANRSVRLTVDVWIGDTDTPEDEREEYRPAVIEIRGFEYCVLDRPDSSYPYKDSQITIDLVEPDPNLMAGGDGNACRLWVREWNAFIRIRACEALVHVLCNGALPL